MQEYQIDPPVVEAPPAYEASVRRVLDMLDMKRQLVGEQAETSGIQFLMAMEDRDPFSCTTISMPGMSFWNLSAKVKTQAQKDHIDDRANTLQKGIGLSLDDKLGITERIINRALAEDTTWALSYSGGRDSTVLSHIIVERMGLKIPHVMSNTRMEYPETIKQVKDWYERIRAHGVECHVCFPDRRPNELWKDIGVPLWSKEIAYKYRKFLKSKSDKISSHVPETLHADFRKAKSLGLKITDKCCDELKKKPMKKWNKEYGIGGHFTGVRCAESRARRLAWIQKGALYQAVTHGNMWIANPLAFWTLEDVETWLKEHKLTVLRPDTPTGGSGCVTCMFGCQARAADGMKNNMQDLKERNPKMWRAALDEWGYRDVLDKMEIPYE
jgi:3'-phosphoadenosine 5'-phosphosulfate sulfotransferase (PAPS reductase)/FAD synthetase